MSDEPILSDAERKDILSMIPSRQPSVTSSEKGKAADSGLESFGSILERTIAHREQMDKEDGKENDEIRKKVIESSRLDIIGQMFEKRR